MTDNVFFEFFAGGGMARAGLGANWRCAFANDMDPKKAAAYAQNFGAEHLMEQDVATLGPSDLPDVTPDLVWSSFPCQDLSLAGGRAGLEGARSGVFHAFWGLMRARARRGRKARMIVLENVTGLITSRSGEDFAIVATALARAGYLVSALVIDAQHFTPQSRKRLFIFGLPSDTSHVLASDTPATDPNTPQSLIDTVQSLPPAAARQWRWLRERPHTIRNHALIDIIDENASGWLTQEDATKFFNAMSERQKSALERLRATGERHIGAAFRRIRIENGARVLRVEARFDGLAGCLRTPAGGSSRQFIIELNKGVARARLMTPREAARLMGLSEDYILPERMTTALKLCGDGVCPPVVQWIDEEILTPALTGARQAA